MSAQYLKSDNDKLFKSVLEDIERDKAKAAAASAAASTVKPEDNKRINGNASINHFLQPPKLEKPHSKPKIIEEDAKSMDEALKRFFNKTIAAKFNYRPLSVLVNIDRAEFDRICKSARENDPIARFDLGRCYAFKIHFKEKNDRIAALWFAKSNELGYTPAKYNLALSYLKRFEGLDHPDNIPRAFQLLYEAATATDPYISAQNNLGACYLQNIGVEPRAENLLLAFFWFKKSFLSGNPTAKKGLEKCKSVCRKIYSDFDPDKLEITTPEVFLEEVRDKIAEINLAYKIKNLDFYTSITEFETMRKRALSLDPKYLSDKFYLGLCYETGLHLQQDIKNAIHYYSESANFGFAPAQNYLGALYKKHALRHVPGSPKNIFYFQQVFKWYSAAAKQGHTEAQYNLACCYLDNQGVNPADPENAHQGFIWLMRSALGGNLEAKQRLTECFRNNYGVPQELHTPPALKPQRAKPAVVQEPAVVQVPVPTEKPAARQLTIRPSKKPEQAKPGQAPQKKEKRKAEPAPAAAAAAATTASVLAVASPESQEPVIKKVPNIESRAEIALRMGKQPANSIAQATVATAAATTTAIAAASAKTDKELIVISDDSGEAEDASKYKPPVEEPKQKKRRN